MAALTGQSPASGFRWRRAVTDAIDECIGTGTPFTCDDIWARLGREPGETVPLTNTRAMGWLMREAARSRRIIKTGITVKGRYSTQGSPLTQWKAGPGA